MRIPVPDNGTPVQPGDDHFVYKNVYHPITWINDLPYRPRVETLVVKDGELMYARLKHKKTEYELPGGSTDIDSPAIIQAKNEINEEALIDVKNIYDSGVQYYEDYPDGFIMGGGDTPLEYNGHISQVFVAEYSGIFDKRNVEEKDLDPKIADNGKFYRIVELASMLKEEHIHALLSCPFVKSHIKGSIRLVRRMYKSKAQILDEFSKNDITGELFIVSSNAHLSEVVPKRTSGKALHVKETDPKIRVFTSIDNALSGFDSSFRELENNDTVFVYAIEDKSVKLYTPTNEESPSAKLTGELWIKTESPIRVKRLGLIRVLTNGTVDKYYYGKNSVFVGKLTKFTHKWITKDILETEVLENNIVVPENKLYHGSTYEITEFKPMSLDLGNAGEEPGWSTFCFSDYTLALRFALMRSIQKVKEYYGDAYKSVVCSWDIIEKKPWITDGDYKKIHDSIMGFKFYVYTINATNLNVGVGNDDRFPEYTFRESGVKPETTDVLYIDAAMIRDHLHIIPTSEISKKIKTWETMAKYHHVRGWYATMMTRDYNNGTASALLQKAVSNGDLNPGDNIRKYMEENGISFDDDSIHIGNSLKTNLDATGMIEPIAEGFLFSNKNLYINYESFKNGTSNVCLVTGLSGSGKTTLGSKIANENRAELIELDMFEQCYIFENDDQLKECGQVFYDYLSTHKDIWSSLKIREIRGKELGIEIEKFLKYCISWCKKDTKTKYVIEGVQIYSFLSKKSLGNTPIVFVNTSALTSIIRRLKRARGISKEDFHNQIKELPQCIAWYIDEERAFKSFKKAVFESVIELDTDDDRFGLPEFRKFPLNTEEDVLSAIKFFNFVDPKYEEELVLNIKNRLIELDMGKPPVTSQNRFAKYIVDIGTEFNKTGNPANWSITSSMSSKIRHDVLKKSAQFVGKPTYHTSSVYLDGNTEVGIINVFRDPNSRNIAHAFIIISEPYVNENFGNTLLEELILALTDGHCDDIDYIKIDYSNGKLSDEYITAVNTDTAIDVRQLRNTNPITESWVPVMEAPNEDDELTPTDYTEDESAEPTNDDDGESPSDYTEEVPEESEGEDIASEPEEGSKENTEEDDDLEGPTDYTEETPEDAEIADDSEQSSNKMADSTNDTSQTGNGNLFDNNVLKNYSLLRNFEKLYEMTKEVSDSLDSTVMPTKLQNTVLTQVLRNLDSIKEFILSYVKFQFSEDNYSQNLYYYNIVMQSLKLNLELLKRNKELEEKKK